MTLVDVDDELEKAADAAPAPEVVAVPVTEPVSVNSGRNTDVTAGLPSIHTDPFTKRDGKTLTWTNINMTLVSDGVIITFWFNSKKMLIFLF
jgi:hypothetical protein